MGKKLGRICMIIGAVLIIAALSLVLWNQNEDRKSGESAEQILSQLRLKIPTAEVTEGYIPEAEIPENDLFEEYEQETEAEPEEVLLEVEGEMYLGVVEIPALGLELPVMSEWSYDKLKKAPCRYKGSQNTDDLILIAHNYNSHFGNIGSLQTGDVISFTNCSGVRTDYEIVQFDEVGGYDIEQMESGDWDLTLFTCTYSGASRVTVRCVRSE